MAALDRWSQNINDLFGKFNCMYLYINTSSNLKMEPKVNEINWKNTEKTLKKENHTYENLVTR